MKAVVSVPLSFTSQQRQSVWKAAEKAGFNILQVISEPAASLLAYGIGQTSKHDALLVVNSRKSLKLDFIIFLSQQVLSSVSLWWSYP